MSLVHRDGDLFGLGFPAIAHGCNCVGSMGGGVAVVVRRRWPDLYSAYRGRCLEGRFRLGDVFAWVTDDLVVYNLATQLRSGADARLDAVESSVKAALRDAEGRGLRVLGMPRIGSGIGGLRREDVEAVLTQVAADSPVELHLVTHR